MRDTHSNRRREREARSEPGSPAPPFVELDPEEAAEYGAFRDDVELADVLEAGDPHDDEPGGRRRGA